jgi:DNA invertase Pin-like site-specific DNA recombinase
VGNFIGYARVSTVDQDASLQLDALEAAGCARIFSDTASGALDERPELARTLDHLRAGDTVVVWRLDRLGRSLRHLIDTVGAR